METWQIDKLLSDVPGFVGTFPCNMLKKPPSRRRGPAAYVINTQPIDLSSSSSSSNKGVGGEHWVALILKPNGGADYHDSYGLPPIAAEITNFILDHTDTEFKCSAQAIQDPLSRTCGAHCVDYLRQRIGAKGSKKKKTDTKKKYLGRFHANLHANDRQVVERLTCQLSPRLRACGLDLKTLLS